MAYVVPVLTTIGGGSAAAGAVIVGATVGVGVYAAQQQRAAGKIAEASAEISAKAEGDAARDREVQRKRLLLRAISSQVARAGQAGIAFNEGSPAELARLDVDEAQRDLDVDRANTKQRQRSLIAQGRAARASANAQSTLTLLDTARNTAKLI